jgi:hypothetical protein
MVRREGAGGTPPAPRRSSPTGGSPVSVSAGAPSSRPQIPIERSVVRAGCQEPLRREPARGPQHQVKAAASTHSQSESRVDHVATKAMSAVSQSGDHAAGLGGVWGAARVHGEERNTRGPSARPPSGYRPSYKPMAKSGGAQRESEGIVVLRIAVTNNTAGGKGPCFGPARNEGTCQGMAGTTGPNSLGAPARAANAQQPPRELEMLAKWCDPTQSCGRADTRSDLRDGVRPTMHATSRRPSVSRVPEIGTHGLKGGPALSPMTFTV